MALQIFDSSRELFTSANDLKELSSITEEETALRLVKTIGPVSMGLEERLDVASSEYKRLARMCGAKLVEFTYGLYPITDEASQEEYRQSIVPEGYLLAADVQIVKKLKRFKVPPLTIAKGIRQYRNQSNVLADDSLRQIKFSEEDDSWYVIDIEPRLRIKPDPYDRKFTRP